jgi:hypothetical protein
LSRARAAAPLLLFLAASCAVHTPVPETIYSACNVLGSSDWKARVEIFESSHPIPVLDRRLIVTGKVRTAGDLFVSLDRGPVARLDDPVQQIMVRTEGSPQSGVAPVTHQVRGEFPALKRYGAVALRCGDGIIAEIKDVPVPPRKKRSWLKRWEQGGD